MSFADFFQAATGNAPFPWQCRLYEHFAAGHYPAAANIPTGLGKTSVVAIWLIALALHPETTPRRLVYVVNRRTVVDQTTDEVEKIRQALLDDTGKLKEISDKLRALCALPLPSPDAAPLAISTLRGQYADNREWSADPTRPAVIIGTVDMIGSGLLFSRYTVGFKLRPHHAAFLGQDTLLVHDEAHLEPAFQHLLDTIVAEQMHCNDPQKLRVVELTATSRANVANEPFRISEEDKKDSLIDKRINAVKKLSLLPLGDGEKEPDKISQLALGQKDTGRAILVFVRSVETATKIAAELEKKAGTDKVLTLTGTMRGKERDELVTKRLFKRFLQKGKYATAEEGTVWLIATSAGEVGVNISADDLICDLSTYESMAQRFGRVNRFGECTDSTITVVHGKMDDSEIDTARKQTLALLEQLIKLGRSASPAALEQLPSIERADAFSPPPKQRIATAIQFDAWALTSIRKPMAARPPVAPYLHGEAKWQPPETHVAWRNELDIIQGDLLHAYPPEDLLEDFPLKPHELLRDTTDRIVETLGNVVSKRQASQDMLPDAWLLDEFGSLQSLPLSTCAYASKAKKGLSRAESTELSRFKSLLADATLILPASLGGISQQGLFTADAKSTASKVDVSKIENTRFRLRASSPEIPAEYAADYRLIRAIDTRLDDEDDDLESPTRYWLWLEAKNTVNGEKRSSLQPETLSVHTKAIVANAAAIAEKLLPVTPAAGEPDLRRCLAAAAGLHDTGKNRRQWQIGIGNTRYDPAKPDTILAKSGGKMRRRNLSGNYRHEFGSINTAMACSSGKQNSDALASFSDIERDIILHLVAAHHGRARPHFPKEEILDYDFVPDASMALAIEVPCRFSRLQRRFGRWGLAWLESLLRAADYAASAGIVVDQVALQASPRNIAQSNEATAISPKSKATIALRVDVANPGQYFACCGLFELASCLVPDTLSHFEQDETTKQRRFIMTTNPGERGEPAFTLQSLFQKITEAEIIAIEPDDAPKTALSIGGPFNLVIDWWRYEGGPIGKLKTWAGQMSVCSIANDMKQALKNERLHHISDIEDILFVSTVTTAGQPYYFDANYAVNAQAQDVGFSIDKLGKGGVHIKTATMPAVELLCLIGLQRARPFLSIDKKGEERLYDYRVWDTPLSISLIPAAVAGFLPMCCQQLRFANPPRAKDYRAFMPAVFL